MFSLEYLLQNEIGELRRIHKLRYWKLSDVLKEKYKYSLEDANAISEFILPMIDVNPEKRASALVMLSSSWLSDVTVD